MHVPDSNATALRPSTEDFVASDADFVPDDSCDESQIGGSDAGKAYAHSNTALFACNFLSKGWEVSILGLLAIILSKNSMHPYMVGVLGGVFLVSQIIVSFFAGNLAHAVHSRNVIFLSIAASGFSWLTLLLSANAWWLFLAFTFGGISSGLFEPIGNSLVAKLSSSRNRNTAIANFAAFGDMGKIAVTAGATTLAAFSLSWAAAVLLLSTVVAFVWALATIPRAGDTEHATAKEVPVPLGDLLKNNRFCLATAAGIADSFSSASLYMFIPFLLISKDVDITTSTLFNVIFFGGYMSGRLVLGRLADKHGAPNMLMACKFVMAIMIIVFVLAKGAWTLAVLLFLLGIFTRGSSPIIRAMVADSMDEDTSFHNAFSAYSFASRGSSALSRPIFSFLMARSGIAAVFYVASAVSLFTLYPAARYKSL